MRRYGQPNDEHGSLSQSRLSFQCVLTVTPQQQSVIDSNLRKLIALIQKGRNEPQTRSNDEQSRLSLDPLSMLFTNKQFHDQHKFGEAHRPGREAFDVRSWLQQEGGRRILDEYIADRQALRRPAKAGGGLYAEDS